MKSMFTIVKVFPHSLPSFIHLRFTETHDIGLNNIPTNQPKAMLRETELPLPVLVGDTLEYEVKGILWHQGTGARHWYLVLWKGYPLNEATWEPESHL